MTTNVYRAFQQQRPRSDIEVVAVIINNDIRLVKGYPLGRQLMVDGTMQQFTGSSFTVPEVSILESDETDKGALSFFRVGFEVRNKINEINGRTSVPVRILVYIGSEANPQQDFTVFASSATLTAREARISLTTENLEKQGKADRIYDPNDYPALQYI